MSVHPTWLFFMRIFAGLGNFLRPGTLTCFVVACCVEDDPRVRLWHT